ncbi:MAG: orotate phosphoribosyltransferase [Burkholderiales bacterium]|jgi:orotate phosphoribosyltransferase
MNPHDDFITFALQADVLRFGSFRTKAGRDSPYFFNAGLFNDGARLGRISHFYAARLMQARAEGAQFDMLFGPAYKGITLASATAVELARQGLNLPFAYNRKEAKDHGEGGTIVGAPLAGRVVIIDDVISAGTSVRESVEIIRAQGATPAAVLIALDRQERGGTADAPTATSAAQEVQALYGIPVWSIASLQDLLSFLKAQGTDSPLSAFGPAVAAYRTRYGVV